MNLAALILGIFTFVELNCENLFDAQKDSIKDDAEYTAESLRRWTVHRYWSKLNHIAQEIVSCGGEGEGWQLPDMVALCEVENDSVMHDLTRRSLLRKAGYQYVMTDSPDVRGIDVALLYSPFSFRLIAHYPLRIAPLKGMRPTRDILYACGQVISGDTLHVFVVHAPSKYGGNRATRPHRMLVAQRLNAAVDSLYSRSPHARILIAGDFNDGAEAPPLRAIRHVVNISALSAGSNGARGTYKYEGRWEHIDHILASPALLPLLVECRIHDAPFLLEEDTKYGGAMPRRNYRGYRYNDGYSDHLPLVARFRF